MVWVGMTNWLVSAEPLLVLLKMSEREVHPSVAQRIIIKFLAREGVKPAEILRRLTAQFGEQTLSRARVFAWHKEFTQEE